MLARETLLCTTPPAAETDIERFTSRPGGHGGGVRGNKNLGVNGDARCRNVALVGDGVRDIAAKKNVPVVGDTARSKIDNGEAGSSGEAIGNSAYGWKGSLDGGGERKGLRGDIGAVCGEGVSGSQYDSGGMGGALGEIYPSSGVEMVSGRGKVARRGVGGRGARHVGVGGIGIVRELGRWRVGGMFSRQMGALMQSCDMKIDWLSGG